MRERLRRGFLTLLRGSRDQPLDRPFVVALVAFGVLSFVLLVLAPYGLDWWMAVPIFLGGVAVARLISEKLGDGVARRLRRTKSS